MNVQEQIKQLTERIVKLEEEVLQLKNNNIKKLAYPNTGKKWTEEEDKKLIDELKQHKTFDEIAEIHKRVKGGVQARIDNHIRDFYHNGNNIKKIAKALCLEEKYVTDVLQVKEDTKPKAVYSFDTTDY